MDLLECHHGLNHRNCWNYWKIFFKKLIHHCTSIAPACPNCECAIYLCLFVFLQISKGGNIYPTTPHCRQNKITISNYMNTICKKNKKNYRPILISDKKYCFYFLQADDNSFKAIWSTNRLGQNIASMS